MNEATRKPRSERRLKTRQVRIGAELLEQMKPGETLVFHFDGVNLREMVGGRKIQPAYKKGGAFGTSHG